jgi:hypothetical protein
MNRDGLPGLRFSKWPRWESRRDIRGTNYPGVYVIAISRKNLAGMAVDWKDISYIGMTNSKLGLDGRWQQFHRSIWGGEATAAAMLFTTTWAVIIVGRRGGV